MKPAEVSDDEEKFIVKQIFDKKKLNNKTYYKIHWKGYLKKNSTWEPADLLIKDGLKDLIDEYEYYRKKFNN